MHDRVELNVQDGLKLALGLFADGAFVEAEGIFRQVAQYEPGNFDAVNGVGLCLGERGKHQESLVWFDRAMALCLDQMIGLSLNRGRALGEMGNDRLEEALGLFNGVLRSRPGHPLALHNRALMYLQAGRYAEAIADFDAVLANEPENANALFGRGFAYLVLGNLREGFAGYEHRLKEHLIEPDAPEWKGLQLPGLVPPLTGKTILAYGEQGLGDVILFSRYLPLMVQAGARVLAYVPKPVRPLIALLPGVEVLTDDRTAWPKLDWWVRMMSLAAAFGTDRDSVPVPVQFKLPAAAESRWWDIIEKPLGERRALRIGLCWTGSTRSKYDAHRSIPLESLAPLAALPGIQIYSLQKDVRDADEAAFNDLCQRPHGMVDLAYGLMDFVDTAAAMKALDLVITVDTSVAHMAGTLGVPTIVMLSVFRAYWLWEHARQDSPWYPSVKVIRQDRDGEWGDVVERVKSVIGDLIENQGFYDAATGSVLFNIGQGSFSSAGQVIFQQFAVN